MDEKSLSQSVDPASETGLSIEPGSETMRVLAEHVADLLAAWESADEFGPPSLGDFLPDEPGLRKQALVELIKVDLELRWGEWNLPKRLPEYTDEFPELSVGELPADLIYEEYHLRCAAGLNITPEDCLEEYPEQSETLRQLFVLNPRNHSTVLSDAMERALGELTVGETVGDFDLIMQLGRGAFARVFLARQRTLQRLVAVKVSADKGTEPQTLAQLDHDYIVRVFDQRILPEEGLRLLYMQYIPGGTLQPVVRRVKDRPANKRTGLLLLDVIDETLELRGEIRPSDSSLRAELTQRSWPEVVAWLGVRLASALDYASGHGVLHRDLKPANVLLTAEGVPKLADFNISFSESVAGANPTSYFGGSLAYMSPEQLRACHPQDATQPEQLDVRADIYSLGVMLWELLAGQRPFNDANLAAHSVEALDDMIDRRNDGLGEYALNQLPPPCPNTLKRVLMRCLAPHRDQRWTSATDLAAQLQIVLEPRARDLIDPPRQRLGETLRLWMVPIVLLMNLIPNAIAAAGNLAYNDTQIIQKLAPEKRPEFLFIQTNINAIAFPIGIAIIIWLARGVRKSIARPRQTRPEDRSCQPQQTLMLGERCAQVCMVEWTIAGLAYPLSLYLAGVQLPPTAHGHFFGSLVISGLIATAYPFFCVTWFTVKFVYPAMLQLGSSCGDDAAVGTLRDRLGYYLIMAASIPMLAIAAVTVVAGEELWIVQLICFGGLIAYGAAYWFYRQLNEDLEALSKLPTA